MGYFFWLFVFVDQVGDQFQQLGVGEFLYCFDVELFDEYYVIVLWVVGQYVDCVMVDEQFLIDFLVYVVVELVMLQVQVIEMIEVMEVFFVLYEFDVIGGGFEGFGYF